MRRSMKMLPLALALALLLAGCAFAFQARVSVTVTGGSADSGDEETSVYIYGFLDEGRRDAAYEELVALSHDSTLTSGEFESFLYDDLPSGYADVKVARYVSGTVLGSSQSGTVATLTIRWETSSPSVGEDYDSTLLYLLAASESDGRRYIGIKDAPIQSGSDSAEIHLKDASGISLDETI